MKTYSMIIIALTAILPLILLTACDKTTQPYDNNAGIPDGIIANPDIEDWAISISYLNYEGEYANLYDIDVDYLLDDNEGLGADATADVIINGVEKHLTRTNYPGHVSYHDFTGQVDLISGEIYTIGFKYNGLLIMSTSIRVPYAADVTYPDDYSPHDPATVQWALPHDNQAQYMIIRSYEQMEGGDGTIGTYVVGADAHTRLLTFPSHCVLQDEENPETYYRMELYEYSYRIVNRILLKVCTSDNHNYELFNDGYLPIDPFQYESDSKDWLLAIYPAQEDYTLPQNNAAVNMKVLVRSLNETHHFEPDDVVRLSLDGVEYILQKAGSTGYEGSVQLIPGHGVTVHLTRNYQHLVDNYIVSIPYIADINFPETYNPEQPVHLTWTTPEWFGDQFIRITSCRHGYAEGPSSEYLRQMNYDQDSFLIPGNIVQNYGNQTEYKINLMRLTLNSNYNVAILTMQNQSRSYSATYR